LIYTESGYTKITVDGVDEFLFGGEMVLVSPYTAHTVSVDGWSKAWLVTFSGDFITSFAKKYDDYHFSKFTCDPQIEKMLQKYLFSECDPEHYMLTSCLYMICNECEKNSDKKQGIHGNSFKTAVIKYVSENIKSDLTLMDVSRALGYEYHYLSSLFNECFGMNFKKFINVLRFGIACRMLADKNKDIASISDECGFGSMRNFNRVFKQMSGITPREYRAEK